LYLESMFEIIIEFVLFFQSMLLLLILDNLNEKK
jgi:hypothetical protein